MARNILSMILTAALLLSVALARADEQSQKRFSRFRDCLRREGSKTSKEFIEKRQFVELFSLLATGAMCPENVHSQDTEYDLERERFTKTGDFLEWERSLRHALAVLASEAHQTGRDGDCLEMIDSFEKIEGKKPEARKLVESATLYCYPGCAKYGGKNCEKAAQTLKQMAEGGGYADLRWHSCTPEDYAAERKLIDDLKEGKKYWELFKLVSQGSLCRDAFELLGIRVEWRRPLEHALATFVTAAHSAGKDEECLHIIDTYPRTHPDFGKNDEHAKKRHKDADDALLEYTKTCYSACAKHQGPNCALAKAAIEHGRSRDQSVRLPAAIQAKP